MVPKGEKLDDLITLIIRESCKSKTPSVKKKHDKYRHIHDCYIHYIILKLGKPFDFPHAMKDINASITILETKTRKKYYSRTSTYRNRRNVNEGSSYRRILVIQFEMEGIKKKIETQVSFVNFISIDTSKYLYNIFNHSIQKLRTFRYFIAVRRFYQWFEKKLRDILN